MIQHLTDQPTKIICNTFINDNQELIEKQKDQEDCDTDTSKTFTSGSDTSEAMHARRTRTGSGRELLLEQASSGEENINTPHTTSTADTSHTKRASSSHHRQATIREFLNEIPKGYDTDFHTRIETSVDGYVQEEETLPQQDSQLNAPITLSQLLTAQDRLNSASCHAKDKIPNAALKITLPQWQLLLLALMNAILHLA